MNASAILAKLSRFVGIAALSATADSVQAVTLCAGPCTDTTPSITAPPITTTPITVTPIIVAPITVPSIIGPPIATYTLGPSTPIDFTSLTDGWSYEIGTTDLLGFGHGAATTQWSYNGTSLPVVYVFYGSVSDWGRTLATIELTSTDLATYAVSGDISLSPTAVAASLTVADTAVPLPTSFALLLTGVSAIGIAARRKNKGVCETGGGSLIA